jgi:hypothetical protein
MNADIFWILIPSLLIGLLAWIVTSTRSVRMATIHAQLQRALIDKIGSKEELRAYCDSHPMGGLLDVGGNTPLEKALESIRLGVVLLVVGVAFIGWAVVKSEVPLGIGLLVTAVGAGCIAAGVVTRNLAQRWGLLDRGGRVNERP